MLLTALQAKNFPASLQVIPGAGHVFMGITPAQSTQIIQRVYRFLDNALGVRVQG